MKTKEEPIAEDEEWCVATPEASFCGGPSMQECPTGIEVPEDQHCNSFGEPDKPDLGNAEAAEGALGSPSDIDVFEFEQTHREGSCELDGSCDDSCSPPARNDCTAITEVPASSELPATGLETEPLTAMGLAFALIGTMVVRWVRA